MEFVTSVPDGALEHTDSLGSQSQIQAGNVQAFTAGRGARHSERNPGAAQLRIFQIRIRPIELGLEPNWNTKEFPKRDRAGQFVALASDFASGTDAIQIHADARGLGGLFDTGQQTVHRFARAGDGYIVVARGAVTVNEILVRERDGIAASDESKLDIFANTDSELIHRRAVVPASSKGYSPTRRRPNYIFM